MAAMVWLSPSADTAQVYVITLMTYLIAVGGFMHIVAGSMEAFMLTMSGDTTWTYVTIHFAGACRKYNRWHSLVRFALVRASDERNLACEHTALRICYSS